ncbi:uncharacterized protein LY89DRAFT_735934 [Mollisia scopiformis]|uniref:Uncharacterized protein n=1 Tax=Mollisia scopiformis TaxID=149040 RepID=A0A194X4Y9_MOLSC|nr:uncharacterized protein LY89DRAFT_735934 [Mollisia scopiformis]KUJ14872.1 hypothetical protein LY89DRAFT_735934 [Mollisia scopiformis]
MPQFFKVDANDWEFMEGTDLSAPILGFAEPHKFFLIRFKRSDPIVVDVRECLLKKDPQAGKTRATIDWEGTAKKLAKAFEGITQKKDTPLGRTSVLVDGVYVIQKHAKLPVARTGGVIRSAIALQSQAFRYADIRTLFDEPSEPSTASQTLKRGRETTGEDEDETEEEETVSEPEQVVTLQKKRLRIRKSKPQAGHDDEENDELYTA